MHAFNAGCNVLAFEKEGKKYAMVCAWSTHIEYDVIGMLVGAQSLTGKAIKVGDKVGVSALALGQEKICLQLGENHSDNPEKFKNVPFTKKDGALLLEGSKNQMECEVIKIMKITDPDDNFIVMKILDSKSDKTKTFLPLNDIYED